MTPDIYGLAPGAEYDPDLVLLYDKTTAKIDATTKPIPAIHDVSKAETELLEAWKKDTDNPYFSVPLTSPPTRKAWYRWLHYWFTNRKEEER